MDYLIAAQVGNDEGTDDRLCSRLRERATEKELATIDRLVHEASVFGEGVSSDDGETATVMLEVLFSPSPRGADGEPWEAHMVKEDNHWKVCGFSPREG